MSRPKLFRDPVHGQIHYDARIPDTKPDDGHPELFGWVMRRLIDAREFQRLRHIRMLGLANLIFHGAEHSRFNHCMGVAYLARKMYDRIIRNTEDEADQYQRLATCAAGLLHDIGHGPFSHGLEEIVHQTGRTGYTHEQMTVRMLLDPDTEVHRILREVSAVFPRQVSAYIGKEFRETEHWTYKIVSSQLDADRLDYLRRDATFTGLRGHGFDQERILDMLTRLDETRIALDRRAIVAIEAYLLNLDHMFTTVYYHHTLRAATFMLKSIIRRAFDLYQDGRRDVFPADTRAGRFPLLDLLEEGAGIELESYLRFGEFHVWSAIEEWQYDEDFVLSDLSRRLMRRRIFKSLSVYTRNSNEIFSLREELASRTREALPQLDGDLVKYYIELDEPERTSYRRYDWQKPGGNDESIWIIGGPNDPTAIENEQRTIVSALKNATYSKHLIFPEEIRNEFKEIPGLTGA